MPMSPRSKLQRQRSPSLCTPRRRRPSTHSPSPRVSAAECSRRRPPVAPRPNRRPCGRRPRHEARRSTALVGNESARGARAGADEALAQQRVLLITPFSVRVAELAGDPAPSAPSRGRPPAALAGRSTPPPLEATSSGGARCRSASGGHSP
ncbi:hypothetical protein ZWY2020_004661 [Hordeum vulgare]|nr:hypothetical protein ZWY2020_004661 [Hordeum vulgare]